ncbi:MAG: peptide chain release factor 1 [Acidimicrobiia bacterium]
MFDHLAALADELTALDSQLVDLASSGDPRALADAGRRRAELAPIVDAYNDWDAARRDAAEAREMLQGEADAETRTFLNAEADDADARVATVEVRLRELLIPKDPNDGRNVIMEIRGAEGGEEANLWARELYDMYRRYAEQHGWRVELLTSQDSDMGGLREVTFLLKGADAWSRLKHEAGPHRVQRVPATESQGRVHTSAATVAVLPEAEEVDVHIDPNDLEVDVFRSSGPGGQSVNTTDSAVRITHVPTGIVVSCQDEKSQLQNKDKALRILRARLLQMEQERAAAELSEARRSQVGGGGRSEKIRTYNFKENRVSDHRINLNLYSLDQVLQGNLDPLVDALRAAEREEQLQS